jgi:metal-responsive CopG/Arc/MetJ family transcriptional regulator
MTMREILTISLDKALKTKVERAAKQLKVSKSELVKKAIEKYIVKEEFRELRALLIPYAEKAGYFTDEDVFKDIS